MSIDEVMAAASRLATTTAGFTTPSGELDYDGESAVQEMAMQLRAAIEQHVAEAVAAERETVLEKILKGLRSERSTDQIRAIIAEIEAIRAGVDHGEVTR